MTVTFPPDAEQIANTMFRVCAMIARNEQEFHAATRMHLEPEDADNPDALVAAIRTVLRRLHPFVEAALPSEDLLLEAPGLNVTALLRRLDTIDPDPATGSGDAALAAAIGRAQLLDAWFEPVFDMAWDGTPAHVAFRTAFDLEGFIAAPDGSLLLPRQLGAWRGDSEERDDGDDDARGPIGLFPRYLRHLTYLPGALSCDHPDEAKRPGPAIRAHYMRWESPALARSPLPATPRIAVAPLAERGTDVTFVPSPTRKTYALELSYDESRLATALAEACAEGVHVLLVPEMALPEGDFATFDERIGGLIRTVRRDFYLREGHAPCLALLLAGVLGPTRTDGFHRNYAVAFDADGERAIAIDRAAEDPPPYEQYKLSHWNFYAGEQTMFGIDHYHADAWPLANPVMENSLPADRFTILDIPGVGRTATLICADMYQNNPGDWLAVNALLDWLHAPIMDKSICWEDSDARREPRAWIVRRTYRAARLARTLVIATNSVALTRWLNEANARAGNGRHLPRAGIGLAIDGQPDLPTHARVHADKGERDIVKTFPPDRSGWLVYPLPAKP